MAGQALLFRSCNLLSYNRSFLNSRVFNVNLLPSVRDLKQDTIERLKSLNIPEKPKKPVSPYFRFVSEHRIKVIKDNPNLKQTEIIRKCAEDWKNVSQALKEKYNVAYTNECVIYDEKLKNYKAILTPSQKEALQIANEERKSDKEKRKLRKIEKETNKPKRPMGAYAFFVKEQSQMRNLSVKDLIPSLKEEWSNLSEEEKNKYKNLFLKEREKYETAMLQWEDDMIKEGRDDLIRVKSRGKLKSSRISRLKTNKDE